MGCPSTLSSQLGKQKAHLGQTLLNFSGFTLGFVLKEDSGGKIVDHPLPPAARPGDSQPGDTAVTAVEVH